MCFSTPFCNLSTDITCHRYKASYIHSKSVYIHSVSNISRFKAVRIDGYQKHSFKYSSGFDGNITDTF